MPEIVKFAMPPIHTKEQTQEVAEELLKSLQGNNL